MEAPAGQVDSGSLFSRWREVFEEQLFATLLSVIGKDHRFCLSYRIGNHSLFVKPAQRIPVVTFPSSAVTALSEVKQREHHFIDLVFVVIHEGFLAVSGSGCNLVRRFGFVR